MSRQLSKMALLSVAFGYRPFFSTFSQATLKPPHKMVPVQHSCDRQFARYISQGLHNTADGRIERKKGRNNTYSSGE